MWISYAKFERGTEEEDAVEKARSVYRRANQQLQNSMEKEERLMLLEAWQEFEVTCADKNYLLVVFIENIWQWESYFSAGENHFRNIVYSKIL